MSVADSISPAFGMTAKQVGDGSTFRVWIPYGRYSVQRPRKHICKVHEPHAAGDHDEVWRHAPRQLEQLIAALLEGLLRGLALLRMHPCAGRPRGVGMLDRARRRKCKKWKAGLLLDAQLQGSARRHAAHKLSQVPQRSPRARDPLRRRRGGFFPTLCIRKFAPCARCLTGVCTELKTAVLACKRRAFIGVRRESHCGLSTEAAQWSWKRSMQPCAKLRRCHVCPALDSVTGI